MKDTLTKEHSTTYFTAERWFIEDIDGKSKIFESCTKEIADRMNMDMNDLIDIFHEHPTELRDLKAYLQQCKSLTVSVYTRAN